MRLSRNRHGSVVVTVAFLAVAAACGDAEVEPDRAASVTTAAPTTAVTTTAAPSPDGLDCGNDVRAVLHSDRAPEFAGFPTPEEAVLAALGDMAVSGTPKQLEGNTWVIVSDDGLIVARTVLEALPDGWWATEMVSCG